MARIVWFSMELGIYVVITSPPPRGEHKSTKLFPSHRLNPEVPGVALIDPAPHGVIFLLAQLEWSRSTEQYGWLWTP